MTLRGQVLKNVLAFANGMSFESRDPRGKGEFVLSGPGKKLWVWQDRADGQIIFPTIILSWAFHEKLLTWMFMAGTASGVPSLFRAKRTLW